MSKYKYRIVKDKTWRFELLPNNSNRQCVGYSSGYSTKEAMLKGLLTFKSFMRNSNSKLDFTLETVEKTATIRYLGTFTFSDEGERFFTKLHTHKDEVARVIKRIEEHYESDIREDLTRVTKEA